MAALRPTRKQYDAALDYFRTGQPLEQIGERLGLDAEQLDQLEHDGWPAIGDGKGESEAMPALRAQVLDRLVRLRAGELDTLSSIVDGASKTSATRAKTAIVAAQIENAIATAWGRAVTAAMKDPSLEGAELLEKLLTSKHVHENLRALRRMQDPMVDLRYTAIFHRASAKGGDDDGKGGDSLEAEIIKDLAKLTNEEADEYARTGKLPSRQQELFDADEA